MLRGAEVRDVMTRVRTALAKAERSSGRNGVVIVAPETTDELGIAALRQPGQLQIEFPSGSARPLVGHAIRFAKRAVRRGLRWYMRPIADQQSRFNQALLSLAERLAATDERVLGELENLRKELRSREVTTERTVDELRADLEAVAASDKSDRTAGGSFVEMLPSRRKALNYKAFEDRHRGPFDETQKLLAFYVQHFRDCTRVLDVGCGRGELLAKLREENIGAYGIDPDEGMVEAARSIGLEVELADVVSHLRALEPGSIDGVISTQVVEHLDTSDLMHFLELAYRKMKSGSVIVLETPNPEALFIFHAWFYVDPTHTKPLHPEAMRWAVETVGFTDVQIQRLQPVPDPVRLEPLPQALNDEDGWSTMARNIERLNSVLYGPQHFALLARKPADA